VDAFHQSHEASDVVGTRLTRGEMRFGALTLFRRQCVVRKRLPLVFGEVRLE
jgi:hypothetical protein